MKLPLKRRKFGPGFSGPGKANGNGLSGVFDCYLPSATSKRALLELNHRPLHAFLGCVAVFSHKVPS